MQTQKDLKSFDVWVNENFPQADIAQDTLSAMRYAYEQAQADTLVYVMKSMKCPMMAE